MARTIVSLSAYLPVPAMRRDANVRPPIVSGWSAGRAAVILIGMSSLYWLSKWRRSSAADEVDQLNVVPIMECSIFE